MTCNTYCGTHGCNQGRDCVARQTCSHCNGTGIDASGYPCTCQPAKVAKVGRKEHGLAPLRGAPWRRHLKDLATAILLGLAGCTLGFALALVYIFLEYARLGGA